MIPKSQPLPRAFEFYDFFSSQPPDSAGAWLQIERLRDVRRGDIVAWRVQKIEVGHDTGHVFFAAETPVQLDFRTLAIRVYDSAAHPHFDDTRGKKPGEFPSGVGSGIINLKVNDAGHPVAFQFGPSDPFVTLPIAIGRMQAHQ
jgi:hypothetical protein